MSKYHSTKIEYDGMVFDSKKELRRFKELSLLEKAGEIQDLKRQVKFEVLPAQREPEYITANGRVRLGNVLERKVVYIADFVYTKDGETVVEDVKGYKSGVAYNLFVIKRKLMLYRHNIRVLEV
mgnify:FL=1